MNFLNILDTRASREMLGQLALLTGDEPVVSVGPPPEAASALGRPVRPVHCPLGWAPLGGLTLNRSTARADVLHFWSLRAAAALRTLPPREKGRTFLSLPCAPSAAELGSLLGLIEAESLCVTIPTAADRDAAIAMGVPAGTVDVLPPAASPVDEQELARRRARAREALGVANGQTLLVAPGEMHRDAGLKYGSWIHAIIRQIIPDVLLALPTGGPNEKHVTWFSNTTGFGSEITLPDRWPGELDLTDALAAADVVLVLGNRPVNTPTLAAAMAAGAAIVATDLPAHAELAPHEQAALLTPADDPRAMAAATLRLIEDRDLAARLGAAAGAETRRRFNPTACRTRLMEIRSAAGQPAPA